MISVMILEGIYNYSDESLSEFHNIYVPLLVSVLRCKKIKCETVDLKGLSRKYKITGDTNENILYVPKIDFCRTSSNNISFIYTDSTSYVSSSFKIASFIRKQRSDERGDRIVFVEQLKDIEPLKNFSPIILDNIKISQDIDLQTDNSYIFELSDSVANAIEQVYGV